MNNIELAEGIYYVGAVDWNLRDFHGYTTTRGVTYNAYLIIDEKVCLIDNVKAPFSQELIERISQIVDPAKIDYVVTNHIEPDHSGSLPAIMARAPQAKVIITDHGQTGIQKHYQQNYDFRVVKEGDTLKLGRHELKFIPLPMLHWPDSMATYLPGEQILFSNDAFGQHICTTKRFDDENNLHDELYEAEKYYANIIMPFGKIVLKALEKCKELPIKMIAPSHGIVWRSHIPEILAKYAMWGKGINVAKVIIAYDSMWGSTEQMARRILEGVAAAGVQGSFYKMAVSDRSEVIRDILTAGGLLIGSSTLNNGVLPNIAALLLYLKGLRPANKIGAGFGAYGWGGGAQATIEELLAKAGVAVQEPGLTLKWVPDKEELNKCFEFGLTFGQKVLASIAEKR
ncbi:MAG TPA: FprA family A-type flavoprotein [Methylomusa anaerophila]|uniref:Nitric oxide reductase n=1 Tax=Methylomusa anaerophila TaxID=1930071 RepID=A0A348AJR5_9FIRM|nr:FprA family A-type flavoprotein [Methylomusa anaerophila]BBB91313.1 nitric oxide reductase [Methylomusa anaerophila]HML90512.1 FprA family A-type flavoprotein [Methylomusa anaerophila]